MMRPQITRVIDARETKMVHLDVYEIGVLIIGGLYGRAPSDGLTAKQAIQALPDDMHNGVLDAATDVIKYIMDKIGAENLDNDGSVQ